MAFLSGFLAFLMSIFSIFGGIFGGFSGGGDGGHGGGVIGSGDVDTSKSYYRPSIVTTDKGTWYIYNPSDGILVLSCDKNGENKYEANLSDYLRGCTEKEIYLSDDGETIICHFVYRTGTQKTLYYPVDYTKINRPG